MPAGAGQRWAIPAAIGAGLVALVAWSTWQRYTFLTSSPFPLGIDGYYYATQLRALVEDGALYYPASPLAFWIMTPLAELLGPIAGAKLGAALGGALVALPAYPIGRRLGGHRAAGLAAAVIATTSAGSWYLSVEFVKNGWGITIGLTALWLILRALERATWPRWLLAGIGLFAAALTHKMALALAAGLAVPAVVAAVRARPPVEVDQREQVTRIAARAAVLGIGVVVGLLALIGVAAFGGLAPLADVLTRTARWHAPALSLDGGRFELLLGREPLVAGAAAVLGAAVLALPRVRALPAWWRRAERAPPAAGVAIAAIGFGIVIALPWLDVGDPQGIGFRLRIVAFVPLALAGAVVAGQAAVLLAPRIAALPGVAARVAGPVLAGALALAAVLIAPAERGEGVVRAHPAMVAAVMALDGAIPAGDTFVVSERAIGFMATYYTRRPFVLRPSAAPPERRWRLMTRAFIGEGTTLYRLLLSARRTPEVAPPRGSHPGDPNGLVLVPEATWRWILERLPPVPRRYYSQWQTI